MKSLGSLRMGLISATLTVAATALAVPAGKGETFRLQDDTPYCERRGKRLFVVLPVLVIMHLSEVNSLS